MCAVWLAQMGSRLARARARAALAVQLQLGPNAFNTSRLPMGSGAREEPALRTAGKLARSRTALSAPKRCTKNRDASICDS